MMVKVRSGMQAISRLWRDTPGAVRARIRMQGVKGTVMAIPQMARFAINHYLRPAGNPVGISPLCSLPKSAAIDPYDAWLALNRWTPGQAEALRRRLVASGATLPKISGVMPVYNAPEKWLNRAIESVREQVYDNWELCIADDCSTQPHVRHVLEQWRHRDARIKVVYRPSNGHISRATNSAADLATGAFIAFLDHDDELSPDALGEVALALGADDQIDLLYSDDDKIDERSHRYMPQFKGDYSPELLLSYMYFCHIMVVRRSLFQSLEGIRPGYEGSQDHDFALRATEQARKVFHLPKVLYHWRAVSGSTALCGDEKPESFVAGRRAVQDALDRRGIGGKADRPQWAADGHLGLYAATFPDEGPSVSLMIPTRNGLNLLKRCLDSLAKTTYRNYQMVIIDNDSDDPATLNYLAQLPGKVLRVSCPGGRFSFAYLNNRAAEFCDTDYILLLNNDTEVIEGTWLSTLMGYAQAKGVGSVGARLLYADGRVQHAGIIHGLHGGLAGHAFKLTGSWDPGYMCFSRATRNVSAVTAACMLTPRKLYLEMGGLDEQQFNVAYNDVDYGYRLLHAGYRNVYCADAVLYHHEGASRGFADNPAEPAAYRRKYGHFTDPYYSPHLSLRDELFRIHPRCLTSAAQGPIRVMYVAHAMTLTGAPIIQYELATQMKRLHGIEPVVVSAADGPLAQRYREQGIPVVIGPSPFDEIFTGKATIPQMQDRFVELIRAHKIDAVYANTILGVFGVAGAAKAGVGSIWNIHESEGMDAYGREMGTDVGALARACFQFPYRIVFGSRATMAIYANLETHHNFTYQHNSICRERLEGWESQWSRNTARRSLEIGEDEVVLLTVGTICERKGQMDLVEAFEKLSEQVRDKVRWLVVGDVPNPYSQKLADTVARWPAEWRRRFSVVRETPDVGRYISAADVFVCSSRIECFPRVTLEAMHMGLPIITTPVYGVPEQVWENVNGLYYHPGDTAKLASDISQLVRDQALRRRLAANSLQVARVLPDDVEVAASYAQMLREAAMLRV